MSGLMKRTILTGTLAAALLGSMGVLSGFAPVSTEKTGDPTTTATLATYKVDTVHSTVLFGIRHMGVSNFYGVFNDFSGEFTFDPADADAGRFTFEVRTASVDTRNADRDDHLRTADFFNSRQFPTISFSSTGVEHIEGDLYTLTGDLTLQGETKPIKAELEWIGTGTNPQGRPIAGYEARFEIKRSDFGMTKYLAPGGSENGGLGNTVRLTVSVEGGRE